MPIGGAIVLIREVRSPTVNGKRLPKRVVARTKTDAEGYYEILDVHPPPRKDPKDHPLWEILLVDDRDRFNFAVTGFNFYDRGIESGGAIRLVTNVNIPTTAEIVGRIVAANGEAIAGAHITVDELGVDKLARMPWTTKFKFDAAEIKPAAKTDQDGRFVFKSLPATRQIDLSIQHDDYYPRRIRVASSQLKGDNPFFLDRDQPVLVSPVEVKLRALVEVQLAVMTADNDQVEQFRILVKTPPHGLFRSIAVAGDGVWKTTAEQITELSQGGKNLVFAAAFPAALGLLPVDLKVSAAELLKRRSLAFTAIRGVRLSGRVVGKQDRSGVPNAIVCWHANESPIPSMPLRVRTNEKGDWEFVVPRRTGFVSVIGSSPGYGLYSADELNADPSVRNRFTQQIQPAAEDRIAVPEFEVECIAKRLVHAVDTSGTAIPNAEIRTTRIETIESEGIVYRLRQELAPNAKTDQRGECELTLSRSDWESGMLYASIVDFGEGDKPIVEKYGRTPIMPNSDSPVRVVLKDPWRVTGRVIIDGRPAEGFRVELTIRRPESKRFEIVANSRSAEPTNASGEFEVFGPADHEYSVRFFRYVEGQPIRDFYSQQPAERVGPNEFRMPDIEITRSQLKTTDQWRAEWAKVD